MRMFSVYTDLHLEPNTTDQVEKTKDIQYLRDRNLFFEMQKHDIPKFPMSTMEFIQHIDKFKKISMEDELLCIIFDSDLKTHVLKHGQFKLFNTTTEALRWCQNIADNVTLSVEALKYSVK